VTGGSSQAAREPRAEGKVSLKPARGAPRVGARPGPHGLAQCVAFLFPLLASLKETQTGALFRSDSAVLAALDAQPGLSGALSALLSQGGLLLPLGSHAYRIAVVGSLFAGLGGLSLLHLAHILFRRQGGYSRLDPWLALGASLSASLSLPWISEATVAGGATVGAGLAAALLVRLLQSGIPRTFVSAGLAGCALGALVAESAWCAGLVATSALIVWPERRHLDPAMKPERLRHFSRLLVLLATTTAVVLTLWAPALSSQATSIFPALGSAQSGPSVWPAWSVLPWISSIGFLWTLGAGFALLFALPDRVPLIALVVWIAADFLVPGAGQLGWTRLVEVDSARVSLHLVGLGLVAPLGALGLRTLGETAQALSLFAARPLAAMVAVLAIAGCLASAEDTLRTLDETETSGAQVWTDAALSDLPDDALILTKSRALGRRLLAAQALRERPDVLVVPLGEVSRPETLNLWLKREPEIETLLRDLSTTDTPSERAITRLVDQRPVFLEPDPTWDSRLLEHVLPAIPLARFSPHALGRSDRLTALDTIFTSRDRIVSAYQKGLYPDAATKGVLLEGFRGLHKTLEVVEDGASRRKLEELIPREGNTEVKEPRPLAPVAAL
jgi:hypothetical protein